MAAAVGQPQGVLVEMALLHGLWSGAVPVWVLHCAAEERELSDAFWSAQGTHNGMVLMWYVIMRQVLV